MFFPYWNKSTEHREASGADVYLKNPQLVRGTVTDGLKQIVPYKKNK